MRIRKLVAARLLIRVRTAGKVSGYPDLQKSLNQDFGWKPVRVRYKYGDEILSSLSLQTRRSTRERLNRANVNSAQNSNCLLKLDGWAIGHGFEHKSRWSTVAGLHAWPSKRSKNSCCLECSLVGILQVNGHLEISLDLVLNEIERSRDHENTHIFLVTPTEREK